MTTRLLRIAALAACCAAASPAQAEVRIGFLGTLSGPAAPIGVDQYDAFALALEQRGGRLGGQPVTLLREDDQLRPDLGVQLARRLVEENRVDVITGMSFSNVMMAVYRPVADAGVILLSSNAGPTPLAGKDCSRYVFVSSWNNDELHEAGGQLANDMGVERVYLMAPNYQAGHDAMSGFKRVYRGQVAGEVYTQTNQPDYSSEIVQLQAAGADAVYVLYPGGMGVNFVKQYRQAGLLGTLPLISVATVDGTTLGALKGMADGAITVAPYAPDLDNPVNREFVEAFRQKYGRLPSHYAAQSYDAALALDAALASLDGQPFEREALRAALRAASFDSVRGGRFGFRSNQFADSRLYRVDAVEQDGETRFVTRGRMQVEGGEDFAAQCPLAE